MHGSGSVLRRVGAPGLRRALLLAMLAGVPAAAQPTDGLEPVIAVHPAYPEQAQAGGLEGRVEVEFTVTPLGTVEQPRVAAAEPAGVFEQAAIQAVSRWRYSADSQREPQTVRVSLDFRPPADVRARTPRAAAFDRPVSGPRNQCVRENAVYNYGDEIEVGLMSACQEPLLVYGCAHGTGRNTGRWVCTDSEQQAVVLVRQNDERIGTTTPVATVDADRAFGYADTFNVTRAPNSQYWWVACQVSDDECRGVARLWARSVNLQPARVNPQHRTGITLARSY